MNVIEPRIEKLFVAKQKRRSQLADMPFHEKVRAIVQLQKMAAPVLRARGKHVTVWSLDDSSNK
ncbi:MAG: hypothetical protein P0120_03325 [Nitrospira sp.]|nr:hypothetical protein [Nitrospira sp.]